jgi:hypothetical protein
MSPLASIIYQVLPFFGLRVDQSQASNLAEIYELHRPQTTVETMAELLAAVPELPWRQDDADDTKLAVMRVLTVHLDGLP